MTRDLTLPARLVLEILRGAHGSLTVSQVVRHYNRATGTRQASTFRIVREALDQLVLAGLVEHLHDERYRALEVD